MDWQCKEGNGKRFLKLYLQKGKTIRIIFSGYQVNFQTDFNVVAFIFGEFIVRISKMPESS